jgi:DNA-binding GntR family transcriptional regulator
MIAWTWMAQRGRPALAGEIGRQEIHCDSVSVHNMNIAKRARTATKPRKSSDPSPLQAELATRILRSLNEQGAGTGHHLVEQDLCRQFGVSRTPVRGALKLLAEQGTVEARANRGFVLLKAVATAPEADPVDPQDEEDQKLFIAVAKGRNTGKLPVEVAQQEIVRMFGARLPTVLRVLRQMADLGLVERKPGNGWSFVASIDSSRTRSESYAFRRAIEPAALLQPTFQLDREWARRTRERHLEFLRKPWRDVLAVKFYEVNSDFHEQLARCSGNRFMLSAVQRQIQLRSFMNYQWVYGVERVHASIEEHLAILSALEAGSHHDAAVLMEGHLLASRRTNELIAQVPE